MKDPYHVYLDLDVINNDYENKGYPYLRFEEIKNNPFLEGDSSEYFCSIVRYYKSDRQDTTCTDSENPNRTRQCQSYNLRRVIKV